jgi:hypothetical protein
MILGNGMLYQRSTTGQLQNRCRRSHDIRYSNTQITMGPVAASLSLYIVERVLTRIYKRQLFRKGIIRKARYLIKMVLEISTLYEVFYDLLEDIMTQ